MSFANQIEALRDAVRNEDDGNHKAADWLFGVCSRAIHIITTTQQEPEIPSWLPVLIPLAPVQEHGAVFMREHGNGLWCRIADAHAYKEAFESINSECRRLRERLQFRQDEDGSATDEIDRLRFGITEQRNRAEIAEGVNLLSEAELTRRASIMSDQASRIVTIERQLEEARAELDAISMAIGTSRFMVPPDGGNVSLSEQVRQMKSNLYSMLDLYTYTLLRGGTGHE